MKSAVSPRDRASQADLFAGAPEGFASHVLNIPAHQPFLKTLARAILDGAIWNAGAPQPHELASLTLYLPSQSAIHPLKLEFLWASPNEATFLPRIRVLGEVDPLDLFAIHGPRTEPVKTATALLKKALAVPPAFSELERLIHLSASAIDAAAQMRSTITEPGERIFPSLSAVSAAAIAKEIGALMDEAHNEGADLARIDRLDGSEASGNEQLSLGLLKAVRKSWAAHKLKACKLDAQERRNRLMAVEAEFLRASSAPVIIAGSVASIAATMGLMETLKTRPNAAIVLHGLDRDLDAESWCLLGDHPEHPQHGLSQLLSRLDVGRDDIRDLRLPSFEEKHGHRRRTAFLSEALRPSSTTSRWAQFVEAERLREDSPAPGLSLIEADTLQEEAATIALILREALETEGQTAALVTPDEALIGRVRHALTRWGLPYRFDPPNPDALALRVAATAASGKPEDFVALIRSAPRDDIRHHAELIDLGALRQMWRPATMAEIPAALARAEHAVAAGEARHPAMTRIEAGQWDATRAFTEGLLEALSPLCAKGEERLGLTEWTAAHSAAMDRLADLAFVPPSSSQGNADEAEATEAAKRPGETAASPSPEDDQRSPTLLAAGQIRIPSLKLDLVAYAGFFAEIARIGHGPAAGESPHPRLTLSKPLDARLITADVIVLGGMNEGVWPPSSRPNPWLNPRDRGFVGLPREERRVGLSARDFTALACAGACVVLTRARKVNGSVTRPSRWIARAVALAKGAGKLKWIAPEQPWSAWAQQQRHPATVAPVSCPAPRPPLSARPRRLSVTAIETWFANPYAIYARHILGLEPLRAIGDTHDARDKGILYHAALHRFFQAYPGALPPDAGQELVRCLDRAAAELGFKLENAPFWRPRFARFAEWFADIEGVLRSDIVALKSEIGGKLTLDLPGGPFVVTARADRIDAYNDGTLSLFDFKTSANAAKVSAGRGAPQLALEGFLIREGAFAGLAPGRVPDLRYIVATGGEPAGETVTVKGPPEAAIEAAAFGLKQRIARFDDPDTPYGYEIRAIFRDKAENDPYAHLARVKEWRSGHPEGESDDE